MSLSLRAATGAVCAGMRLSRAEARSAFDEAVRSDADPVLLGGFLAALAARGETAEEIAGAAEAVRAVMLPFAHDCPDAIDTCGTGGDGLGTFNLSTAAALVAAAAGARVIKHGNRAASSRCGSADLLEALGIPLELAPEAAATVLEETGITFLYAPHYHPALRHAAPVRRALGVRTMFNWLGPLCHPGGLRRHLLGVSQPARLGDCARVLAELGYQRAYVVHGAGGADELTLAGANTALAVGEVPQAAFDAPSLGLPVAPVDALRGGDAAENARLLAGVLAGEAPLLAAAVALNAAAALVVAGVAAGPEDGLARASEVLRSGAAAGRLQQWRACAARVGA